MKNYQNKLPLVSIIVPCLNEKKFIAECLDSIVQQNYPKEKMEVLVIDGMSNDKTREIIKQYSKKYPFIQLINNPKKITPIAFNLGIKNANGEIIIIMGAHTKYKNDYISKCVNTSLKYNIDNVGGVIKTISKNKKIITKSIAICLSSFFGAGNSHFRKGLNKIKEVDTVFGGCYKKQVFKKIGLFNEKLIRSQDIEFNIRLKKAGGKILLNPEIVSYYYPKSTLKKFFKHNIKDGFWVTYPLKFNVRIFRWRHLVPLFFVSGLIIPLILSIFIPLFIYLFLFILGLYLIVNLFFSTKIAIKKENWKYIFLMPVTFIIRHIGYGIGSIWGIFKLLQNKNLDVKT